MESLSQASLADPYAEGTKMGLERKLFEVRVFDYSCGLEKHPNFVSILVMTEWHCFCPDPC